MLQQGAPAELHVAFWQQLGGGKRNLLFSRWVAQFRRQRGWGRDRERGMGAGGHLLGSSPGRSPCLPQIIHCQNFSTMEAHTVVGLYLSFAHRMREVSTLGSNRSAQRRKKWGSPRCGAEIRFEFEMKALEPRGAGMRAARVCRSICCCAQALRKAKYEEGTVEKIQVLKRAVCARAQSAPGSCLGKEGNNAGMKRCAGRHQDFYHALCRLGTGKFGSTQYEWCKSCDLHKGGAARGAQEGGAARSGDAQWVGGVGQQKSLGRQGQFFLV